MAQNYCSVFGRIIYRGDNMSEIRFSILHVGINEEDGKSALELADLLCGLFGWEKKDGNSSVFSGSGIEIMKGNGKGQKGHIAIAASDLEGAIELLRSKGVEFDESSKKYNADGSLKTIYLAEDYGGFALHIMQE